MDATDLMQEWTIFEEKHPSMIGQIGTLEDRKKIVISGNNILKWECWSSN